MANLYNFPNLSTGIDSTLSQIGQEIVLFPIMILVFTYLIVLFSGITQQQVRRGYADVSLWNLIAFMTLNLLVLIMSLGTNIINTTIMSVVLGGTFFSALWFFMSRGRFEQ